MKNISLYTEMFHFGVQISPPPRRLKRSIRQFFWSIHDILNSFLQSQVSNPSILLMHSYLAIGKTGLFVRFIFAFNESSYCSIARQCQLAFYVCGTQFPFFVKLELSIIIRFKNFKEDLLLIFRSKFLGFRSVFIPLLLKRHFAIIRHTLHIYKW